MVQIPGINFLGFAAWRLGQDLNLKMLLEERRLILSVYNRAMKAKVQMMAVSAGKDSFIPGGFGVPVMLEGG